jgi:hypothetical protein
MLDFGPFVFAHAHCQINYSTAVPKAYQCRGVKQMQYNSIPTWTASEIEAALIHDQPDELSLAVLSAALYASDRAWAEDICIRLAQHHNENVRGNAILGFGHLARLHGELTQSRVQPLIEKALDDPSKYIRGHAENAADDVTHFLKWSVRR